MKFAQFLLAAKYICKELTVKSVAGHTFHAEHSEACSEHNLKREYRYIDLGTDDSDVCCI